MLAAVTLSEGQIAAIASAGVLVLGALVTAIIRLRNSRSALNLQEDTHLYARLREQQRKQDARITVLEKDKDVLMREVRKCESHKAACEARLALLEEMHGIQPPPPEDEDPPPDAEQAGDGEAR